MHSVEKLHASRCNVRDSIRARRGERGSGGMQGITMKCGAYRSQQHVTAVAASSWFSLHSENSSMIRSRHTQGRLMEACQGCSAE